MSAGADSPEERRRERPSATRSILHVDMDEFFAAVEKLDNPALRGKPILVGGDPKGRGVVSTASYEARVFGCHSAMPMSVALRLCPHAIVIPVHGKRYAEVSRAVFEILGRFTPLVEPLSIDEAFMDVSGCGRLYGPAIEIARQIKDSVRSETGLTASVGVAPNMFLAKLASDLEKPDGLVVITPETLHEILDPLPMRKLWGVGPAAEKRLKRLHIETIGDIRRLGLPVLKRILGALGEHAWRLADGRDDRVVEPDSLAKSIGQEQTFAVDVGEIEELRRILLMQIEHVGWRLRRSGLHARTVTLKLRYADFTTITRASTLAEPTDLTDDLWRAASRILDAWARHDLRPLRLLGATCSHFTVSSQQIPLFGGDRAEKLHRIDRTIDGLADKYGHQAVRRAGTLSRPGIAKPGRGEPR